MFIGNKSLRCRLGFHNWEYGVDKAGDPVRGCLRCNKIQTFALSFGLSFWHDFAKGWTYTKWKKYIVAITREERRQALES